MLDHKVIFKTYPIAFAKKIPGFGRIQIGHAIDINLLSISSYALGEQNGRYIAALFLAGSNDCTVIYINSYKSFLDDISQAWYNSTLDKKCNKEQENAPPTKTETTKTETISKLDLE